MMNVECCHHSLLFAVVSSFVGFEEGSERLVLSVCFLKKGICSFALTPHNQKDFCIAKSFTEHYTCFPESLKKLPEHSDL